MNARARACWAIVVRDARLYVSYRGRFAAQIFSVVSSLTLFYFVSKLVGGRAFRSSADYYEFAVVGLAILQMLTATFTALPQTLRQEMVAGTLQPLITSPFGPGGAIVAMTIFPSLIALAVAILTITIAALLFGLDIDWATAPLGVPLALLSAVAFMPVALLLAAVMLIFRQALFGANALVTVMSLLGGFFFPVTLLPGWVQFVSNVQPFTPAVELLRHALVGTPLDGSATWKLLKLALFATVAFPVAWLAVQRALRMSQRRGTVLEY